MAGHEDPAENRWWYNHDDYTGSRGADDNFFDMFGNSSSEDLFKFMWEGGTAAQHPVSNIPPLELPSVPLNQPPSDETMAAWLYPIISGEAVDKAVDSTKIPPPMVQSKPEPEPSTIATVSLGRMTATESKGKLAVKEDMSGAKNENTGSGSSERRKAASGGSSRSSQHSVTHNSTERRRRCKITDRLRTLQQLVPGCDKSNQVSTLEQTIQYMKSLQQQLQSMNTRPSASAAAAMYPTAAVAMPIPATAIGQVRSGTVVPMVPYAHYHAVMMPAPGISAAPEGQCSISTEQQRHKKDKGKRRL